MEFATLIAYINENCLPIDPNKDFGPVKLSAAEEEKIKKEHPPFPPPSPQMSVNPAHPEAALHLRDDAAVKSAGLDTMALAQEAETLLARFPNATVNADEQRRLRAALYKPMLPLAQDERARVVDLVVKLLLLESDE